MAYSSMRVASAALSGVLVTCALVVTYITVDNFLTRGRDYVTPSSPPTALQVQEDWQNLFSNGHHRGADTTSVGMVVFSDYECPACLILHDRLQQYERNGNLSFAVQYRHWPLSKHRFAEQAAVASECAAAQDRFQAMHDLLFANQARLGVVPWKELAAGAGVRNLNLFERCLDSPEPLAKVRADAAVAQSHKYRGTPTVIVAGGTRFAGVPSQRVLDSLVSIAADRKVAQQRRQ